MDYITEFLVNVVPNLLRYQIMDALEKPAKLRIQQYLDTINVEELIKKKVPEFRRNGTKDLFNFVL